MNYSVLPKSKGASTISEAPSSQGAPSGRVDGGVNEVKHFYGVEQIRESVKSYIAVDLTGYSISLDFPEIINKYTGYDKSFGSFIQISVGPFFSEG